VQREVLVDAGCLSQLVRPLGVRLEARVQDQQRAERVAGLEQQIAVARAQRVVARVRLELVLELLDLLGRGRSCARSERPQRAPQRH
jgi:hypothetical protein